MGSYGSEEMSLIHTAVGMFSSASLLLCLNRPTACPSCTEHLPVVTPRDSPVCHLITDRQASILKVFQHLLRIRRHQACRPHLIPLSIEFSQNPHIRIFFQK